MQPQPSLQMHSCTDGVLGSLRQLLVWMVRSSSQREPGQEPRLSGTPYRMLHLRTPDSQGMTGKVQADENSSQRTSQTVSPPEHPGRKACSLDPNGSLSLPTDMCCRLLRTATLPAAMLVPRGGATNTSAVFS